MLHSEQFSQLLSQVHFHLLVGDFELCEELINKAEIELKGNYETESHFAFNMVIADLYRSTGRRELCFNLWDQLLQRSENDLQRCICYSEKALDSLKIEQYDEAFDHANEALRLAATFPEHNKIKALQIQGACFWLKEDWANALKTYSQIAAIAEKINNQGFVAKYHAKMAMALKKMGYINLALDRLYEAEEHAQLYGETTLIQNIALWRADLFREMGEDKKALTILQRIVEIYDDHL